MDFLKALKLLTVLPVPFDDEPLELERLALWFPLAGALTGGLLLLVSQISAFLFQESLASLFVVIFWVFITRGRTIKGLADLSLHGKLSRSSSRETRIAESILYAVLVLVMVVLLKSVILSGLRWHFLAKGLMLAPLGGSWGLVIGLSPVFMEPGETLSRASIFKRSLRAKQVIYASVAALALSLVLGGFAGFFIMLASAIPMVYISFSSFSGSGRATYEKACFVGEAGEVFILVMVMIAMRLFLFGY